MKNLRTLVVFALYCVMIYCIVDGAYVAYQKEKLESSDYFIIAVCCSFFASLLSDKKQVKSNG